MGLVRREGLRTYLYWELEPPLNIGRLEEGEERKEEKCIIRMRKDETIRPLLLLR